MEEESLQAERPLRAFLWDLASPEVLAPGRGGAQAPRARPRLAAGVPRGSCGRPPRAEAPLALRLQRAQLRRELLVVRREPEGRAPKLSFQR